MADGNIGPIGELSAAEAKQHKACTRGAFREREAMRLRSNHARTSKLCVTVAWFVGYLATQFAGMERSEAKDFMPRLDLLVHHPLFKDVTAYLCRLMGFQAPAGFVAYVLGAEIVVSKYGAICYIVLGELLALALMWRAACGGVITSFQDISALAGTLCLRKDVLLAGCAAKGIEGLVAVESMVTQVLSGCGKGALIKERLPVRATVADSATTSATQWHEELRAELARNKRERDEANACADAAEAEMRRQRMADNGGGGGGNNNRNNNGGNNNNNNRNNNGGGGPPRNNGGNNNNNNGGGNNNNQRSVVLDHPADVCSTCTGRGHLAATCVGRLPFMIMVCNTCKGIGHPQRHCPSLHH